MLEEDKDAAEVVEAAVDAVAVVAEVVEDLVTTATTPRNQEDYVQHWAHTCSHTVIRTLLTECE